MRALALLLVLASPLGAEDYRCTDPRGCTAIITQDGEVEEVPFRRGDIVSTEDGWILPPGPNGWRKLNQRKPVTPPPPPPPKPWWERFWDWISW